MTPLEQHQIEIERNLALWRGKPLLQTIYAGFYETPNYSRFDI